MSIQKRLFLVLFLVYLLISGLFVLTFQVQAEGKQLSASKILNKVDNVLNSPKDQDLKVKLVLINKKGKEKIRKMRMLQKGTDKRLVKFLSPADQKGIGFLSLPNDNMYLYLPAFK